MIRAIWMISSYSLSPRKPWSVYVLRIMSDAENASSYPLRLQDSSKAHERCDEILMSDCGF